LGGVTPQVDSLNVNVDLRVAAPICETLPAVVTRVSAQYGESPKHCLHAFSEGIRELSASLDGIHHSLDHFTGDGKPTEVTPTMRKCASDPGLRKPVEGEDDDDDYGSLDRHDRMLRYRFVRKIEPDLPPIASLKSLEKFGYSSPIPSKCCNDIIVKNKSPEYIQTWLPHEREKKLAMRSLDGNRRMHAVRQRAKERTDLALEAAVEGVARVEARQQQIEIYRKKQRRSDLQQKAQEGWYTSLALVGFMLECRALVMKYHQARQVFSKEMGHDGAIQKRGSTAALSTHILVDQFVRMARLQRSRCLSSLPSVGGHSSKLNLQPENRTWGQTAFLQTFILCKMRVRIKRSRAKKIHEALSSWSRTGLLLVTMKRFRRKVIRIQRFWRWSCKHLAQACEVVTKQWIPLEREFLAEKLRSHSAARTNSRHQQGSRNQHSRASDSSSPEKQGRRRASDSGSAEIILGLSERVDVAMLCPRRRHHFIVDELRVCRFEALPAIKAWEEKMHAYHDLVQQWRETRVACQVMGVRNTMNGPEMPACPRHLPKKEELMDMVQRAHNIGHPRHVKVERKRNASKDATSILQRFNFLVPDNTTVSTPPGSAQGMRRSSDDFDPTLPSPLCLP
jgi:hypothetical protein